MTSNSEVGRQTQSEPETVEISYSFKSDIGLKREINQDSSAVLNRTDLAGRLDGLFIVADGMGGAKGGEVASRIVAQTIPEAVDSAIRIRANSSPSPAALLQEAISRANYNVYAHKIENKDLQRMGTTCVTALINAGQLTIGNVGDSRAYLLRQGKLIQLTEDHSVVWEQVRAGQMTREEAQNSRFRNEITKAIGIRPEVEPDIDTIPLEEGDTILLCSDGLTTEVNDSRIARILAQAVDAKTACEKLVDAALRHGGSDNITVVVVRYGAFVPSPSVLSTSGNEENDLQDEDTDPDPAWRSGPVGTNRSGMPPYEAEPADRNTRQEARRPIGYDRAIRRMQMILGVMSGLALLEAVAIGWFWFTPHNTHMTSIVSPPKSSALPTDGPLEYDTKPTVVLNKPLLDNVLQIAPDNSLLAASQTGRLLRIKSDGSFDSPTNYDLNLPKGGNTKGTKSEARLDVALDASGNRFQIQPQTGCIEKYNKDGARLRSDIGRGALTSPTKIAVSGNGDIYVIDSSILKRIAAHTIIDSTQQTHGQSNGKPTGKSADDSTSKSKPSSTPTAPAGQ